MRHSRRWPGTIVEHQHVADEEAQVLLFKPASTLNTRNAKNEQTVEGRERI
jgi:hypothetical protein